MNYILLFVFLIYTIYTLRFALKFNKTADSYFNKKQIILHNFLIWLIPFFWIMIIKTVASPTPGSKNRKRTKDKGNFYESGLGIWGHTEEHHSDFDGGQGHTEDH